MDDGQWCETVEEAMVIVQMGTEPSWSYQMIASKEERLKNI